MTDNDVQDVKPKCAAFGVCGGCCYQDVPYSEELQRKTTGFKRLFMETLDLPENVFEPIVASPKEYHYRNRIDLKLLNSKMKGIIVGYTPIEQKYVVEVDECPIAMESISAKIPEIRQSAKETLPKKYRMASLCIRTGDDGRVFWGGIGKGSLRLEEEDYLWTEVEGLKIFYGLETFFQANLSILPIVMQKIKGLGLFGKDTVFFDLYGGVGLFGLCFSKFVNKVYSIEENPASHAFAKFNIAHNNLENVEAIEGQVEDNFFEILSRVGSSDIVAMIDPPRAGLSQRTTDALKGEDRLNKIIYLSCNPETLVRDLAEFLDSGWGIERVIPFDFFPKTRHLEALTILNRSE